MKTAPFLALCAALAFVPAVHARHHRHRAPPPAPPAATSFFSSSLVDAARSQLGNGAIYGRRNLWCARFVNYVLEKTGHKGTGSDAAASFTSLPRTEAHPGAIAIMRHHVGIVSGMDANGNPILVSGNNLGRVREAPVSRSRVVRYVEAQ